MGFMEYVWSMHRLFMEYVCSLQGICMEYVTNMHRICMEYVWKIMEYAWNILDCAWNMYGNDANKVSQNPSRGLDFHVFLGLGACQGTPWRPSQGGTQKNMKKSLLETFFLEQVCDKCWHFSGHVFHLFFDLSFSIFVLLPAPI